MRPINRKACILALNSGSLKRDLEIIKSLKMPYKALSSQYDGTQEDSYLVLYDTNQDLDNIIGLAQEYGQESILILREDRSCYLIYMNDLSEQELGWFRDMGKVPPINKDWSLDLTTGKYWAVVS